jgi:hypothetical protein
VSGVYNQNVDLGVNCPELGSSKHVFTNLALNQLDFTERDNTNELF